MIYSKISGGLGNQLFQYAAGRAYSMRLNTQLVLDLGWFENRPRANTPRAFELQKYAVNAGIVSGYERWLSKLHNGRFISRLPFLPRPWKHVREQGFDYDHASTHHTGSLYLDGYWQSYKYFQLYRKVILSELRPLASMSMQDNVVASLMIPEGNISVHVRRGDYVSSPAAMKLHGIASIEYYAQSINKMKRIFPNGKFFIFSDDLAWAKENLPLPSNSVFVGHNDPENAFQDLRLMSMCNGQIIANSSFSWWGAWLSECANKHVIAPLQWFANGRPTPDLIPPEWERI